MKTTLKIILGAIILFVGIPVIGIAFVPSMASLPFLVLTLYLLPPLYFIYTGYVAGCNIKQNWLSPLLALIIFVLSTYFIYGTFDTIFLFLSTVPCAVSIVVTSLIKNRKHKST